MIMVGRGREAEKSDQLPFFRTAHTARPQLISDYGLRFTHPVSPTRTCTPRTVNVINQGEIEERLDNPGTFLLVGCKKPDL